MKTALMVIHGRFAWPGALADILPRLGYGIHICHVSDGCTLPEDLDGIDAVFLMGGPMGVYEASYIPWLKTELDWVKKHVDTGTPFFGICLGCQILAHTYGGEVHKGGNGLSVGFKAPISTSDDAVFNGELLNDTKAFSWQQDTYTLPEGTERLATNSIYPEQAVKFSDTTYAVQFHPETTLEIIEHLYNRETLVNTMDGPCSQNISSKADALEDAKIHLVKAHEWLEATLRKFLVK